MEQMHQASRQGDGSPTIQQTLLYQAGIRGGHNHIMRLMREEGIRAKRVRCFKWTPQASAAHRDALQSSPTTLWGNPS